MQVGQLVGSHQLFRPCVLLLKEYFDDSFRIRFHNSCRWRHHVPAGVGGLDFKPHPPVVVNITNAQHALKLYSGFELESQVARTDQQVMICHLGVVYVWQAKDEKMPFSGKTKVPLLTIRQ
jgi:hypothetical protein